jgi:hypothetical protein
MVWKKAYGAKFDYLLIQDCSLRAHLDHSFRICICSHPHSRTNVIRKRMNNVQKMIFVERILISGSFISIDLS